MEWGRWWFIARAEIGSNYGIHLTAHCRAGRRIIAYMHRGGPTLDLHRRLSSQPQFWAEIPRQRENQRQRWVNGRNATPARLLWHYQRRLSAGLISDSHFGSLGEIHRAQHAAGLYLGDPQMKQARPF